LRATINAAIIASPRHQLAIQIVAKLPSRLSRYTVANKMARIAWAVMARDEGYRATPALV
jgi:hypothetical protein